MRRVLAEKLRTVRIPQGNLDESGKRFLKHLQLRLTYIVEQQILIGILLLMLGQEPEVIIGIRHHVRQRKLFLLRQVYRQLHIVRGTLVGHQPAHVFLEERLSPHHQMRKYGLIRCVIAEMLVAREHIMHESCSATPVTENKYRVVLQRFVRQQLLITFVLQGSQYGKHAANGFRQPEFTFVRGIYFTSFCNGVERFPVCTDQCVNRQFVEF